MSWQQTQTKAAAEGPGPQEPPPQTAAQVRQSVWDKLEHTLKTLPTRHTLLLLGDFNTPLAAHPRAGRVVTKWNSRLPADAPRLTRLLDDYDLMQLNSWSRRAGPTYICGEQRSLIDHALAEIHLSWLHGVLVAGTFRSDCLMQLLSEPQCPQALQLRQSVQHGIANCYSIQAGTMANTGHAGWSTCHVDTLSPWRQAANRQTSAIWRAWYHFTKFRKAHREFRGAGRLAKHAWYSDRLHELGTHARRHNIRALYQGVQRLAPKKRFAQVQLRAPDGGLISPERQAQLLSAHLRNSYTGRFCQPDRSAAMPSLAMDATMLSSALASLSVHKAVPEHLAPIAAWRLCSDEIMPELAELVNNLTAADELWHAAESSRRFFRTGFGHMSLSLQLSPDLSSAFDHMEWAHIAVALEDASVPSELQAQVLEWYRDIKYVLTIQGQTVDISASRGLKQGCLIAPLIWSLVTGRFLYELALCSDPLWVTADVTTYADDFHAGSQVQSYAELCRLEIRLGQLLDVLCTAGLTVNAQKSAVLFLFRGTFASKWLKQHVKNTPDGQVLRLRTPKGMLFEFPVAEVHTYLGVRISYKNPRLATLQHRVQLVQAEWSRLRKVVCSKRGLFLKGRINICTSGNFVPFSDPRHT
ncbi:unnamed protein product [Symbiodinium sp. CCMP2592]|nr:unnamed protein product [Symbiodinium sp. CCMP2592]